MNCKVVSGLIPVQVCGEHVSPLCQAWLACSITQNRVGMSIFLPTARSFIFLLFRFIIRKTKCFTYLVEVCHGNLKSMKGFCG